MRSGRPQLLHVASLDVLGPLRDVNLVLVLHVLREGLNIQIVGGRPPLCKTIFKLKLIDFQVDFPLNLQTCF